MVGAHNVKTEPGSVWERLRVESDLLRRMLEADRGSPADPARAARAHLRAIPGGQQDPPQPTRPRSALTLAPPPQPD